MQKLVTVASTVCLLLRKEAVSQDSMIQISKVYFGLVPTEVRKKHAEVVLRCSSCRNEDFYKKHAESFNAAHFGGARSCEAGFHPITPRRHDNKQRKQRRKKPTKKETFNEERKQRRKKTTKKETFNEERNHQRRKKPTKKTKLVNDEGFIIIDNNRLVCCGKEEIAETSDENNILETTIQDLAVEAEMKSKHIEKLKNEYDEFTQEAIKVKTELNELSHQQRKTIEDMNKHTLELQKRVSAEEIENEHQYPNKQSPQTCSHNH
ncbi:hypothetical protein JTB14_019957 [Gonioctena quinquepunctata]|nr:hypothetical protein JTB14_019957 [Gonioctena quinquepunctata]